jgi:hypothetical protein
MSPCVTTFRATWAGAVAVAALFALALLPVPARAQTKDAEEELKLRLEKLTAELAKAKISAQSQSELEHARAELAKLQSEIKARQDQIKALEKKIADMQAGKGHEGVKDRVVVIREGRGEDKNPTEIVLILRKVGDRWEVVQAPARQPERKEFRVEEKEGVLRIVPVEPGKTPKPVEVPRRVAPIQPEVGPRPGTIVPPSPGADSRLENLERQLKRIMDELEALRKEMKSQPRPGGAREESGHRIELRLDGLEKNLPPGVKVEEKDGVRYFTLPLEVKPNPKAEPKPEPKKENAPR